MSVRAQMVADVLESPLLTKITTNTGVPVYVLSRKVAPLQQSFYFVNDGMSGDGRYLWFYCAFPPSLERTLGLADFVRQEVRHFPETQFNALPWVEPETGDVFWGARDTIWCRTPEDTASPRRVNALPQEIVRNRHVHRLATHLSRSADGSEFFIDAAFCTQWILGTLPIDGSDFRIWQRLDRNHNHAQFSPTDPNLVLFAQEFHSDPITGIRIPIDNRMWLIERGGSPRPALASPAPVSHEWWDADGQHVWCVHSNQTWRTSVRDASVEKITWPDHCWHGHSGIDSRYLVSDCVTGFLKHGVFRRGCASEVFFLNRDTGRSVRILENPAMLGTPEAGYHIDPHPRFCCGDRFVVFTTTIRGQVDVALVRTEDLIDRTC